MGQGSSFRFDSGNDAFNLGPNGDDNLNSLDAGGNVFATFGVPLEVTVTGLRYNNLGTSLAFVGTTLALTDNATNFVFINETNALAFSTSSFPPDRTEHVPLAEVTASGGSIIAIADRRQGVEMLEHAA